MDRGFVCERCVYPVYFVINNDRVVRLSDGRLIVPVAKHPSSMGLNDRAFYDGRGACYFFESSDDGVTWRQSRAVLNLPENSYSNSALQEPGLIEMPNGVL